MVPALACLSAACSSLPTRWPSQAESASSPVQPQTSRQDWEKLALRVAQSEARMEALERQSLKHKERLKLLEKGLTLGLLPAATQPQTTQPQTGEKLPGEKLPTLSSRAHHNKNPNHGLSKTNPVLASLPGLEKFTATLNRESAAGGEKLGVHPPKPELPAGTTAGEKLTAVYAASLSAARALFDAGRYGKAYLEFAKLEREFDAQLSAGEPTYWLGRCWYQLKEHQQAEQYFGQFIKNFPTSKYLATAKLYRAKNKLALGLEEQAVALLRSLTQEHADDGSAEAAKQLLSQLSKTL